MSVTPRVRRPENITVLARALRARNERVYQTRGYAWACTREDPPKPVITGDEGQFYLDAVADEHEAVWLMELLRRENPNAYEAYRQQAMDDGIDLDESQDTFLTLDAVGRRMGL